MYGRSNFEMICLRRRGEEVKKKFSREKKPLRALNLAIQHILLINNGYQSILIVNINNALLQKCANFKWKVANGQNVVSCMSTPVLVVHVQKGWGRLCVLCTYVLVWAVKWEGGGGIECFIPLFLFSLPYFECLSGPILFSPLSLKWLWAQ